MSMNVCICCMSVCAHVLMSLLAYMFQLSYRVKSGMLVEHFIREMLWGGKWEGGSCLGTHVRIKDFKI